MEPTELINKFLRRETTPDENNALLTWVELSPENAAIFAEAKNQRAAGEIKNSNLDINLQQEFDLTWNRRNDKETETNGRLILIHKVMRYAATILVTFALTWLLFNAANLNKPAQKEITYNQVFTSKGQKTQLVLIDGTKIWLNSASRVKYGNDYNQSDRKVYLDGEAFFDVAKNPGKPFLVITAKIAVKALGTSFNVKAFSNETAFETTLMTGSVSIENQYLKNTKDSNHVLIPNQRYVFSLKPNPQVEIVENRELKAYKAWKDNVLVFQSESLGEIALKLERWFDVNVHILDKSVVDNIYSGTFKNKESLQQVLAVLKQTTPIGYTIRQHDVYIFKK